MSETTEEIASHLVAAARKGYVGRPLDAVKAIATATHAGVIPIGAGLLAMQTLTLDAESND